jgi:hypothetical protein
LLTDGGQITPVDETWEQRRPVFRYDRQGSASIRLAPGASHTIRRRLLVGESQLEINGVVERLSGREMVDVQLLVHDEDGPVPLALVTLVSEGRSNRSGRTNERGVLKAVLPLGEHRVTVASQGRAERTQPIVIDRQSEIVLPVERASYVEAEVTDADRNPIACKVEFQVQEGPVPDFGPDTFVFGIQNLQYTADGTFRAPLLPGRYRVIVSRGCEYDAVFTELQVRAGETVPLRATLRRTVDTPGWISADFHSHSTPSGDNTSHQDGRVLNLLAEQIEFAPCTEHNRITTYDAALERLQSVGRMATCPGMELTGSPLPINHQNAFPLVPHPRTQDGGGPVTDPLPEVQIERLAMWDRAADKLVQANHPHLHQMFGDRDLDGHADEGFRKMFRFMDVVEIHPLDKILLAPDPEAWRTQRGNVVRNWLQMLNLGYRIPGVVNTDAHYNFHGSGWLRNYIRSATDNPALINTLDVVHAAERGQLVMTNGPFLEIAVTGHDASGHTAAGPVGPGDDLALPAGAGRKVQCRLRVQCPNWLDINRVQLWVNGRVPPEFDFRRADGGGQFSSNVVRFEATIPVELSADAHLIAVAAGEGLQLGPVVGPNHMMDQPMAIANPIYVDIDGDGFNPSKDLLDMPLPGAAR